MVIYPRPRQSAQRLGTVTSQTTAVFTVPVFHLGTTGKASFGPTHRRAEEFFEREINVQPGQSIKWTIENDIDRSFLGVY